MWTVPGWPGLLHGTRRGQTLINSTLAGTTTRTWPDVEGSVVGFPSYTASTSREGPAGKCVLQPPFAAVVTTAACVKSSSPLSGAVITRTVCPPRAVSLGSPSQPLTVVPRPWATHSDVFVTTCGRSITRTIFARLTRTG